MAAAAAAAPAAAESVTTELSFSINPVDFQFSYMPAHYTVPTETGYIRINVYARKSDYSRDYAIQSIHIEKDLSENELISIKQEEEKLRNQTNTVTHQHTGPSLQYRTNTLNFQHTGPSIQYPNNSVNYQQTAPSLQYPTLFNMYPYLYDNMNVYYIIVIL